MGSPYKYIERINGIISEKGVPKLSPKELKRLLKIVALEYHERALRSFFKFFFFIVLRFQIRSHFINDFCF